MFSYVDLVRTEIAVDAGGRFNVFIPDEVTDEWRTLGDVARTIAERTGGRVTEPEAFDWVRTLMAEVYGVSMDLTPDGDVFDGYDRVTRWFFARARLERSRSQAETGDAPDESEEPQ